MVDFAAVGIILGVVGFVVVALAITCAVRCAVLRRRDEEVKAAIGVGVGAGLLDKEVVVVDVEAKAKREGPLCAICKGPLAGGGMCRRLRACGHVYHAECIDLWLQRKAICPLCRAAVVMSRADIVDAIV